MWEDPIVAEVHRAREQLAAESNYDIRVFFAGLKQRETQRQKESEPTAKADRGRHSDASKPTSSNAAPAV